MAGANVGTSAASTAVTSPEPADLRHQVFEGIEWNGVIPFPDNFFTTFIFYRPAQQVHQCGSGMAATLVRGTTWNRDVGLSFDGRDRISLIQGSSRWCYQLEGMTDWWYFEVHAVFQNSNLPLNFVPYMYSESFDMDRFLENVVALNTWQAALSFLLTKIRWRSTPSLPRERPTNWERPTSAKDR